VLTGFEVVFVNLTFKVELSTVGDLIEAGVDVVDQSVLSQNP